MRFVKRYFLLVGLFVCSYGLAIEFLPNFGDVPQAEGIILRPDTSLSFETAEGRIAEIIGDSVASLDEVSDFYRDVLPVLGWSLVSRRDYGISDSLGEVSLRLVFGREGESLTIDFFEAGRPFVRFQLSPKR